MSEICSNMQIVISILFIKCLCVVNKNHPFCNKTQILTCLWFQFINIFFRAFFSCDDVGDGSPTYEYLRHDEHALNTVGLNDGRLLCVSQYHVDIPQNALQ